MGDDDERGREDNTGSDHRPGFAQDKDRAPKGHIGTAPRTAPSFTPGGATSSRHVRQAGEQTQGRAHEQPSQDKRPIAIETGDKDVDRESARQGQRVMSQESIRKEASKPELPRPNVSQSDYAKAFQQANQKTAERQKSRGHELE